MLKFKLNTKIYFYAIQIKTFLFLLKKPTKKNVWKKGDQSYEGHESRPHEAVLLLLVFSKILQM